MNRLLYPLFALASYALGMASILYLAGFLLGLGVPKTIDHGPSPLGGTAWASNAILLLAYLTLHSVMARPAFKDWWMNHVPPALERAIYVLVSALTTFALAWAWQPIPEPVWAASGGFAGAALYGVNALGWAMIVLATFNLDHLAFFGLRQAWDHFRQRRRAPMPFTARFLYALVRHPISLGWLLVVWGTPRMSWGHLMFAAIVSAYIVVVTPLEERDLLRSLGKDYTDYRQRVRAFLPWPRRAG